MLMSYRELNPITYLGVYSLMKGSQIMRQPKGYIIICLYLKPVSRLPVEACTPRNSE